MKRNHSATDAHATPRTDEQHALLVALLDEIIPASTDGRFPSAGSLPFAEFLAQRAKDVEGFAELLEQGLNVAATLASPHDGPVTSWQPEKRLTWATDLERREPAFFAALVRFTYLGYYTHPSIPPLLGLSDMPPHPNGYEVPGETAEDVSDLVKPVIARGSCYLDG